MEGRGQRGGGVAGVVGWSGVVGGCLCPRPVVCAIKACRAMCMLSVLTALDSRGLRKQRSVLPATQPLCRQQPIWADHLCGLDWKGT